MADIADKADKTDLEEMAEMADMEYMADCKTWQTCCWQDAEVVVSCSGIHHNINKPSLPPNISQHGDEVDSDSPQEKGLLWCNPRDGNVPFDLHLSAPLCTRNKLLSFLFTLSREKICLIDIFLEVDLIVAQFSRGIFNEVQWKLNKSNYVIFPRLVFQS